MTRIRLLMAFVFCFWGCVGYHGDEEIDFESEPLDEETNNYDYNAENDYEINAEYKYNYKDGEYYNYDISGYDEDGNYVSGNVDIDEYWDGYIEDEYGNEKYIEVEWVDWGVMEGYDEDGVYYELNVE